MHLIHKLNSAHVKSGCEMRRLNRALPSEPHQRHSYLVAPIRATKTDEIELIKSLYIYMHRF